MILTKFIDIRTSKNRNIKYYLDIGYDIINKDFIQVDIKDIPKNSNHKVLVKCDKCGLEKQITYQKYNQNIKKYNYYCCSQKCSQDKTKSTNLIRYGVKHVSQNENIKDKIKQTVIEKFGVETILKSKKIRDKINNTNLERYGVENVFASEEIKDKIKQTNIEKYGVDNFSKTKEYTNKIKNTNLERYGVDYYSKIQDFSQIIKQIKLEKYGDENYNNREKFVKTCMEKFNTRSNLLDKDIIEKIKNTKIKNGKIIPDNMKDDFVEYKKLVKIKTNNIRKTLFDIWDGYDYYDKSYIKENLKLDFNHKLYPTIDHEKSVFYCFINGLSVDECCDIDNLKITTRSNNSKKQNKNYL
jgi:hypothetical protein